jgi:membrane protease YdiL (CAAX protease family)
MRKPYRGGMLHRSCSSSLGLVGVMSKQSAAEPEVLISGRRFGLSLLAAVGAAAGAGFVIYYGLVGITGRALGSTLPQIVTLAVYAAFLAVFCYAFRPSSRRPIALRFTGARDVMLTINATILLIAFCAVVYLVLGQFFGGFRHLLGQLTAVATDAKRLQGESSSAWIVAILRGCLLVPVVEEVFFRGLLLTWLNQCMRFTFALLVMSALFAGMHVYPLALPYTFFFGIASGCLRHATGSTLNAVVMHVINNLFLLAVGLHFFSR